MENPICNTTFDSRDLIEYKEYLEEELVEMYNDYQQNYMVEYYEQYNPNLEDEGPEEVDNIDDVDFDNVGFADKYHNEIQEHQKLLRRTGLRRLPTW